MQLVICLLLGLNILNSDCMVRSVSIDGAAYKNIVFEINNKVPVADCTEFLLNLEVCSFVHSQMLVLFVVHYNSTLLVIHTNEIHVHLVR